jgi:drug/metabolite transporter (DMT)-like permease
LKALGFTKRKIVRLLTAEYGILMISGVFMGSVAAVIAVLPAFLSANTDNSPGFIAIILLVIILNGFIWMYMVARGLIRK